MAEVIKTDVPLAGTEEMILATESGLRKRHFARRILGATNGAYYMIGENSENEIVAVFKPKDEEDVVDRFDTVLNVGEKADREVAAYVLDRPRNQEETMGFLGVPPTAMVEIRDFKGDGDNEWKKGSLQKFMGTGSLWLNPSWFPVDQVHKMSLIDIRFGNSDRHRDNFLALGGGSKLIPIDHGGCFPKKPSGYKFIWKDWRQAAVPYSQEIVDYVNMLNPEDDLEFLKGKGIELGEEAEEVYKVQCLLLKTGVLGGYTAREIGRVMITDDAAHHGIDDLAKICRDMEGGDLDENTRQRFFKTLLRMSLADSKRAEEESEEF